MSEKLHLLAKYEDIVEEIEFIQEHKKIANDYHAFVYWFISTLYDKDEKTIKSSICDGTHDKGIDAVLIDPEEKTVSIIQSKFERAGNKTQLKENEVKLLCTVRDYFKTKKALAAATFKANKATQNLLDAAFVKITDGYTRELIFITTHKGNPAVDPLLRDTFHFSREEFRVFCYDNILALMANKTREFLPMNKPYNLPFQSNDGVIVRRGEFNSWILTVKTDDVRNMAINYPDNLLFRKNVRGFLSEKSETNRRMLETLGDTLEGSRFWYYNNGITILCNAAKLDMENKYIHLVDPEIVNGCQTVTTIKKYKDESAGELIVRVIESQHLQFMNSVILYQNSSNPVKPRDFKSNDPVQVRLHHDFFKRGWYYEVKRGLEFKPVSQENKNIADQCDFGGISNSEVSKALASIRIHPYIASSKGDDYFFGEGYGDIFTVDTTTFQCLGPLLLKWLIRDSYSDKRWHTFAKEWLFKNSASHFVLKTLHSSPFGAKDWEKDWIAFWENTGEDSKEWKLFLKQIRPIIDELFETAYEQWVTASQTNEVDPNSFFKQKDEVDNLFKQKQVKIESLQRKTVKAFQDHAFHR